MTTIPNIQSRREKLIALNKANDYVSLKLEELKNNGCPIKIAVIKKKRKQY